MSFLNRYARSVNATDLRDDPHHHATESLGASGWATRQDRFGALLARLKFADGTAKQQFESGARNLPPILREWETRVIEKGTQRKWLKANTAWDIDAALAMYRRVAHGSLAHWLDGRCIRCFGAGQTKDRRICEKCKGAGKVELPTGGVERQHVLDMTSELEEIMVSYIRRAAANDRREP